MADIALATASQREIVIEPGVGMRQYWADLWRFRELFYFMAWRELLVRYKQTVIGIAWSVIRPVLTVVVFTIVFGRLARLPSNGVPYAVLVFAGLLPWQFLANSLSESSSSLISNASMISKVYFPRTVIPVSAVIVSFVELVISFVVLIGLLIWYRVVPGWQLIALPLFTLLAFAAATGAGLWIAALNVKYRDFRYIVPFVVQFGLYVSPVGFSSSVVPSAWRLLYSLNPMVGVIDGYRWAILGNASPIYWPGMAVSIASLVAVLMSGLLYFRSAERAFADWI